MTTLDRCPSDDTLACPMVEPDSQPSKTTVLVIFRQRPVANWIAECLREIGYAVAFGEGYDDAFRALQFIEPGAAIVNVSKAEGDFEEFLTWFDHDQGADDIPIVFVVPSKSQANLKSIGACRRSRTAYLWRPLKCSDLQHIMLDLLRADRRGMEPDSDRRLVLDPQSRVLQGRAGSTILTPTEYRLAEYMTRQGKSIIDVEEALTDVLGFYPGDGNPSLVWAHLRSVRQKIRMVTGGLDLVQTVGKRGFTYLDR